MCSPPSPRRPSRCFAGARVSLINPAVVAEQIAYALGADVVTFVLTPSARRGADVTARDYCASSVGDGGEADGDTEAGTGAVDVVIGAGG